MKFNKRTTTIILWAISIGLLAGMVISFTPGLSMIGAQQSNRGPVYMTVNGQNVHEFEVQQARSNALFASVTEGEVGEDLERLMVDQIVRQAVLQQAASRVNVSGGEVRQAVNDFREERGVAGGRNDRAYQQLIGSAGFSDQAFREYLREQLRIAKFEESIVGDVTVSDEEVEAYYQSHLNAYQTEERVLARQIVVDDVALAQELRRRAMAGEEFADLAQEYSLDLAERAGAIGAASGETEPRPVGRPALPTPVANATFALRGAGITDVIPSNQRYYVVQVEEYLPAATRPFEEVEETVREDALNAKKEGLVEAELDRLREEANVTFPSSSELSFENPVLAEVNGVEIRAVDLDAALYTNPQIQQALSPQTADLIVGLFKPTVLSQVIDTEVAYQSASELDVPLVGTRAGIAQAALNYIGRDATASEQEIVTFYESNIASFTLPAEAVVTRVDFTSQDAAMGFRQALLDGAEIGAAAADQGGTVDELGLVKPGEETLELDVALFSTEAFEPLPNSEFEVSDILVLQTEVDPEAEAGDDAVADAEAAEAEQEAEASEAADDGDTEATGDGAVGEQAAAATTRDTYVVLVANRVPERVRPLEDVRAQVEAAVVAQKRQTARTEWLAQQRAEADIIEYSTADLELPFDALPQSGAEAGEAAEQADEQDAGAADETGTDADADADLEDAGATSEGATEASDDDAEE